MSAKILVVEDSPAVLESVAISLQEAGYNVVTCTQGRFAIDRLKAGLFDLVICDLVMPETNGLEVLMYLKRTDPALKTIIITGADPIHQQSALDFGAALVLTKPLNLAKLNAAVARLVNPQKA